MNVGANRLSGADTILFAISYSFCIDLGSLLDTGDETLRFPDRHSVHCLVDVRRCWQSGFQILSENPDGNGLYSQVAEFDDFGNESVLSLARALGSCGTCDSGYSNRFQSHGFQATVIGTLIPRGSGVPLLEVEHVVEASVSCDELLTANEDTDTDSPSDSPSKSPTMSPTVSPSSPPTISPSGSPSSLPTANIVSDGPTSDLTFTPSADPTGAVSKDPTTVPSSRPSVMPSVDSSGLPTLEPGEETMNPSLMPSKAPAFLSTSVPSSQPSPIPSSSPTVLGSPRAPTMMTVTENPTIRLSMEPTLVPSSSPSGRPTVSSPGDTSAPSVMTSPPSEEGTDAPTEADDASTSKLAKFYELIGFLGVTNTLAVVLF